MKIIVLSLVMLVPTLVCSNDQKRPATPKPVKKIPSVKHAQDAHMTTPHNIDHPVLPTSQRRTSSTSQPKKSSSKGASLPKTQPAKGNADHQ